MMTDLELAKREAARAYRRYFDIADSREYSCGAMMAAFINPELAKEAKRFNQAMRILKRLDPNCPKYHELSEGA